MAAVNFFTKNDVISQEFKTQNAGNSNIFKTIQKQGNVFGPKDNNPNTKVGNSIFD